MLFNYLNKEIEEIGNKIDSKRILILAGNPTEFGNFVNQVTSLYFSYGVNEGVEYINYTSPDSVRGIIFDDVMLYGTGKNKAYHNDIRFVLAQVRNQNNALLVAEEIGVKF